MAVVLDWSSARLDPAAVKAAGVVGVCRYQWIEDGTRPAFNQAKAIRRPEYDALLRAGLTVTLNCQVDKADYLGGYATGLRHGQKSLLHSREMGHPDSRPVILTVQDTGIPSSDYHIAIAYMSGFVNGRGQGPQACYGGTDIGNLCVNAGLAKFLWVPIAATSWSRSSSSHIALKQLPTKSYPQFPSSAYDENQTVQADWGQHPGPEEDMATSDEYAAAAWGHGLRNWVTGETQAAGNLLGFAHLEASEAKRMATACFDKIELCRSELAELRAIVDAIVKHGLTDEQVEAIGDAVSGRVRSELNNTKLGPST